MPNGTFAKAYCVKVVSFGSLEYQYEPVIGSGTATILKLPWAPGAAAKVADSKLSPLAGTETGPSVKAVSPAKIELGPVPIVAVKPSEPEPNR